MRLVRRSPTRTISIQMTRKGKFVVFFFSLHLYRNHHIRRNLLPPRRSYRRRANYKSSRTSLSSLTSSRTGKSILYSHRCCYYYCFHHRPRRVILHFTSTCRSSIIHSLLLPDAVTRVSPMNILSKFRLFSFTFTFLNSLQFRRFLFLDFLNSSSVFIFFPFLSLPFPSTVFIRASKSFPFSSFSSFSSFWSSSEE